MTRRPLTVAVSRYFLTALLDFAAEQAVSRNLSVYDTLQALATARMKEVERGRFIVSFSNDSGASTSSLITGGQAVTPAQIVEAYSELRYLYRRAKKELLAAGTTDPQQEDIMTELYEILDGNYTESYCDHSEIRLPNTYAAFQG